MLFVMCVVCVCVCGVLCGVVFMVFGVLAMFYVFGLCGMVSE